MRKVKYEKTMRREKKKVTERPGKGLRVYRSMVSWLSKEDYF